MIEYGTILRYFAMSIARYREPRGKHVHGWMAVNESLQSPIMAFVISKAYRPLYILIRIFQCWKCSIRTVCRYSIYLLLTTDKKNPIVIYIFMIIHWGREFFAKSLFFHFEILGRPAQYWCILFIFLHRKKMLSYTDMHNSHLPNVFRIRNSSYCRRYERAM